MQAQAILVLVEKAVDLNLQDQTQVTSLKMVRVSWIINP